jgi:predicted methyltransferase
MDAHQSMLGHILEALKPGGRLVLVEPAPRPGRAGDRQAQARSHEIGIEFAEADLEEAGFEIVDRRETFTERDGHGDTEWLLVGRKPAGAVTGGPYQLNW